MIGWFLTITLFAVLAIMAAGSDLCTDSLDWSPGLHIPYSRDTLQYSISHVGDKRRLRPILNKLDNESVSVLIVGGSEDSVELCKGCGGHLWQDVFADWLRRSFPAQVTMYELYLTGDLSRHLETVPEYAKAKKPDMILFQPNLTNSDDVFKAAAGAQYSDEANRILEAFIRSLLELPGQPAVIWMQLTSSQGKDESARTNSEPSEVLTNYYDLPRVNIPSAWRTQIDMQDLSHLSQDGHKLIAVTLSNFVCFELLQACNEQEPAIAMLPRPLTWEATELDLEQHGTDYDFGPVQTAFCQANKNDRLAGDYGSAMTGGMIGVGQTDFPLWSLAAPLVAIPLGVAHELFVRNGGGYSLENKLPIHMPELELLRVVATLNIVLFQYYQELPPTWARPACHPPKPATQKPEERDAAKATLGLIGVAGSSGGDRCLAPMECTMCRSGRYWFQFYFLLSGFVLTLSIVRNGPTNAVWQYAQVWPLHVFGLLLSVLSLAQLNSVDLALAVTLMHSWVTPFHSHLNGPSWYLSTLVAFWIFVPLWVRMADSVASRGKIYPVSACLVIVWLCTLVLPIGLFVWPANLKQYANEEQVRNFVEYSPYSNWQPFCSGILLACLAMQGVIPNSFNQVVASVFIALVGLCIAWFLIPSPGAEMGLQYLLLDKGFGLQPLFALLVLGCLGSTRLKENCFRDAISGKVWMHWCARLCWPVFILHQPVHMFCERTIFQWFRYKESMSYWCAIVYPITLVFTGVAASKLIDQPWAECLYKFRNKYFRRQKNGQKGKGMDKSQSPPGAIYSMVSPRNGTEILDTPTSRGNPTDNILLPPVNSSSSSRRADMRTIQAGERT